MPLNDPPAWVRARRLVIGGRVRTARLDADLTQAQLGERAGIDHKTVHRIEYGQSDPRLSILLLIADAIGVPLSHLVRE